MLSTNMYILSRCRLLLSMIYQAIYSIEEVVANDKNNTKH